MVISEPNSAGKTVFLRAAAVAQLLFQAGLPVIAKSFSSKIYSGFFYIYSSSESNNLSGRFEAEAARIASFLELKPDNMLLLLNEPFQSTLFREGEEKLYDILECVSKINNDWILVTHLGGLVERYKKHSNTASITVNSDHKINVN